MRSSLRQSTSHVVTGLICHLLFLLPLTAPVAWGQSQASAVPHLVKFSGVVKDAEGKVRTGTVGVTFALYKDEQGGAALWLETQNVQADAQGRYSVYLGAAKSSGLPQELFMSGEARWLGVQAEAQAEQPRTLLLSVPYALKAGDAETVGGLPPSAFVLAAPGSVTSPGAGASPAGGGIINPNLGGSGTANFIPLWTDNSGTLGNSVMFQSGTGSSAKTGVNTSTPAATLDVNGGVITRGALQLPSTGTANAGAGFNSQSLSLQGSSFNSGTQQAIGPVFRWQTEPSGNNTSSPAGTLNLLYGNGGGQPSETGLNIASNGRIVFASGQTFPGAGTITGVTAGTGLTGGGTSGNVTLSINVPFANQNYARLGAPNTFTSNQTVNANLNAKQLISTATQGTAPLQVTSTTQVPNLNVSLLGGLPAGSYATLNGNSFNGNQSIAGNLTASGTVTAGTVNATSNYQLGGNPFAFGSFVNASAFLGFAGNPASTGPYSTGIGYAALASNTTGPYNTATGYQALFLNTTGGNNVASGWSALYANTTGSINTAYGVSALELNTTGWNNTAIGGAALFNNTVGQDNTANGTIALNSNTTGNNNTADGFAALFSNTTGVGNTASGFSGLQFNTTGSNNTSLGNNAGNTTNLAATTGSNDTFVGANSGTGTQTALNNAAAIGANAQVTASNAMVLGSINGVNGATADTLVGIGTTAPVAKLDVHGTGNFTGLITFAPGQTFPGTGTITGVTAGTDLIGGGTSGSVTLNVDTTKVVTAVTAGTDLTGGGTGGVQTLSLDTTKVPQLNTANSFTGNQNVNGNLNVSGTYQLGGAAFAFGSSANASAFLGFAGNTTSPGFANTASGSLALAQIGSGCCNTASGWQALTANSSGSGNSAFGWDSLNVNTSGTQNTAVGYVALGNNVTGSANTALGFAAGGGSANSGLYNTTAIGANSQVDTNNSMVLGSINGVNGAIADTNVGIGTTAPAYKLHVGGGNNGLRVEGPPEGTPNGVLASFGGAGEFSIDAPARPGARFLVKDYGNSGAVLVGIGTPFPDNTLTVNGTADKPGGGSWGTFSDGRLKTLHGNFDAGLSQILKLHPIRYRYKKENALGIHDQEEHIGFVAQDVKKVIPEAVTANNKGYLLVNNDPILWTMLNAIKEQQHEIASLRGQLRQRAAKEKLLESRLVRLEHDREESSTAKLQSSGRRGCLGRTEPQWPSRSVAPSIRAGMLSMPGPVLCGKGH